MKQKCEKILKFLKFYFFDLNQTNPRSNGFIDVVNG